MGGLRFLPLISIAACANLSGLNGLEVGDAESDVAQGDAGGDEIADTSGPPVPDDGGGDAGMFCVSQAQALLWCADFDEGDVTKGFLNGVATSWTNVSAAPALSAMYASPPASAHFEGANKSSLTFSHAPGTSGQLEVTGQLQVTNVPLTGDCTVFVVQLTPSYNIKLLAGTGGLQGFALSFNEGLLTDAGTQVTPHPIGNYSVGTWIYVDVVINFSTVTITAGSNKSVSFGHTEQATQSLATQFTFDTSGWAGNWDSIRATF